MSSGHPQRTDNVLCISYDDVLSAHSLIKPYIVRTPLLRCTTCNYLSGKNVFLKAENLQTTGSFKFRGAVNAIARICAKNRGVEKAAVVAHSSGNHAQAVAKAASLFGACANVVMPKSAPACKKQAAKSYGAIVSECEPTEKARIAAAEKIRDEKEAHLIHSSQTPEVIAGQGTIAVEMLHQNPDLDAIVAPVGGGGMISGIAVAAKHIKPSIKVYGAEPELANDCFLSMKRGRRTPLQHTPKTIADGAKVNIGENTWAIINDLVDDVVTVSEEEIVTAVKLMWERAKLVIEPTAGLAVAAVIGKTFSKLESSKQLKNIGVVISGGNVDFTSILSLLETTV